MTTKENEVLELQLDKKEIHTSFLSCFKILDMNFRKERKRPSSKLYCSIRIITRESPVLSLSSFTNHVSEKCPPFTQSQLPSLY